MKVSKRVWVRSMLGAAAATARSGVASEEALMNSIFLPPAIPFFCFRASSAPRMPSWPGAANGPSSVARRPIFKVSCDHAEPVNAAMAAIPSIVRTQIFRVVFTAVSLHG